MIKNNKYLKTCLFLYYNYIKMKSVTLDNILHQYDGWHNVCDDDERIILINLTKEIIRMDVKLTFEISLFFNFIIINR